MKQLKWEYSVTLLFLFCSVLIIILMTWQGSHRESYRVQILQEIDNVQSSGFTLQEVPSTKFKDQAITDYHELIERPLFFTSRVPFVPEESEQDDKKPEEEVKVLEKSSMPLIGIIDSPIGTYALFHNPKAKPEEPKFQRMKQGEEINGWLIKEIKHDRVIISADENVDEILLAKPRKHKKVKSRKKRKTNPFKQKIKK
ncbi:conserved hypothetical protein [Bathymodiolus platifrons methanotrophic gill symbiont]|uniref:hypothetical protein n=1 Tax=Bathymodiolus platifrons methanotrophic gill symbiont TaxID=113268 RepID=UPI000B42116E|nr:hypothetical protein [Bathymodiolus platifrons methanotrophic gill symbiont]TXL16006.1 hypothetical protein BMR05_01720 [Methylococcaceae bacterium HT4]TXL21290.1 hypothetical protein BMR06_01610 [Methylococcaceae bacterium HT5]GAW86038.1 conserved hypothetical protein [Bathymodiolus platifrons methanotrophic gill symbiont]GFO76304.1 general secretion pathway protein N [Bathymodiolus platifrons methanotrophic gill symbiont]